MAAPGDFTTLYWNPAGGKEVSGKYTKNGLNIYYEGNWSWTSNGKYTGREYRKSGRQGAEGYGAAAYWSGTVNTLYEIQESKNLANNMIKAKAYQSVAGTVP